MILCVLLMQHHQTLIELDAEVCLCVARLLPVCRSAIQVGRSHLRQLLHSRSKQRGEKLLVRGHLRESGPQASLTKLLPIRPLLQSRLLIQPVAKD